ncbi:serine hydrolase domain-containing protein [Bifidobacterium pseudocatenulatum]|uniref:serine hydrolase domain-containing protein n=1 Tax=Bifidobacterium pseudocatenulatum TaxID=28026 RepID=UPI0022E1CD2E|nr:serine hydrolase [Bifidobacterium pseudocatenulatum]
MGVIDMFNDFVKLIESESLPVEAVAIADGDAIIAERHFVPDQDRNIYSHTKSYVSTAIGIAIEDGLLSLDSRLVDSFPEYVPSDAQLLVDSFPEYVPSDAQLLVDSFPEYVPSDAQLELGQITLRHLLTMSSGFNHAYLMNPDRRSGVGAPDYLRYMFSRRVEVEPGSTFCYSSADSDLAGRMLEQAAGMRLGEYLYGTIFSKLDQGWPVWECDPQGHPIAGGGIYMSLANMLKLGQVYLNDGTWHGTRIVSESWVKQASGKQIDTPYSNIWTCGYGYQFWMSPYEGAYRADGAYGQITTVLPKQGLVVAIQCPESGDFDNIVRPALHEHLLLPLTA